MWGSEKIQRIIFPVFVSFSTQNGFYNFFIHNRRHKLISRVFLLEELFSEFIVKTVQEISIIYVLFSQKPRVLSVVWEKWFDIFPINFSFFVFSSWLQSYCLVVFFISLHNCTIYLMYVVHNTKHKYKYCSHNMSCFSFFAISTRSRQNIKIRTVACWCALKLQILFSLHF